MDGEDLIVSGDSITTTDNTGKFCAACGNFVPSYKQECDVCSGTEFANTFDEYKQRKEAEIARLKQMREEATAAVQAQQSEE